MDAFFSKKLLLLATIYAPCFEKIIHLDDAKIINVAVMRIPGKCKSPRGIHSSDYNCELELQIPIKW